MRILQKLFHSHERLRFIISFTFDRWLSLMALWVWFSLKEIDLHQLNFGFHCYCYCCCCCCSDIEVIFFEYTRSQVYVWSVVCAATQYLFGYYVIHLWDRSSINAKHFFVIAKATRTMCARIRIRLGMWALVVTACLSFHLNHFSSLAFNAKAALVSHFFLGKISLSITFWSTASPIARVCASEFQMDWKFISRKFACNFAQDN